MRVYTGTGWINASSAQVATMKTYVYVAAAAQTTFSGNDANGSSLTYVAPYLIVSLNGLELRPVVDYTATSGLSVVLTAAATTGDELQIQAFSAFNVANIQSANVSFQQSGTGATPRTVDVKLKEFVSVADFGAVGNSTADDSLAFTRALATSNCVVIPDGFLCRVANVFVGENKEVFAAGSGGLYIAAGTTGLVVGSDAAIGARSGFIKNIRIHDLQIVGQSVATGTYGIRVNQAVSGHIYNIAYDKCDAVIYQQCADGFVFENIHNVNLEDASSDCNHIVKSATTVRNNDCEYKGMVARSKKAALFLDASGSGEHDGVTITANVLFPTSTTSADTVFVKNAIWVSVTGNKFFVPQRHALRVEGFLIDGVIANNLIAWPGASEPGEGISVVTTSGSAAGAYGAVDISNNVIVTPTGHGIEVSGLQGLTITDNTILAPNNRTSFATPVFTKYGIHLTKCGNYQILNNNVTVSLDGRDATLMPREWMWDVVIEGDCTFGVIDHKTAYANESLVLDMSGFAKLVSGTEYLTGTPLASEAGNGVDPYYVTPGSWSKSACTMSAVTDSSNPVPNVPATNNTTQIAFTAAGGFAQVGANGTTAGGSLVYSAYMRTTSGNALCNIQLQPNGGTQITKQVVLDSTYRKVTFVVPNTISAGYSLLTIINAGNNTPTVNIAGLSVTTTRLPIPQTFKTAYGAAAPAFNSWTKGDRVINSSPAVGQPKSWICTTTGVPGVWVSEGNL
jgi:hypothetical protein